LKVNSFVKALARPFADALVRVAPGTFASSLRRNHPEKLFGVSYFSSDWTNWDKFRAPSDVQGFEDLYGLFFQHQANRGIVMLDIDESATLYRVVKNIQDPKGIEIGRFRGGSTVLLAVAVGQQGHLYSLDIEPRFDEDIYKVLSQLNLLDRVEIVVSNSSSVSIDYEFDFAFIDGDHSYRAVKLDYNNIMPVIKEGGLIIFHDMAYTREYASQALGAKQLRDELLKKHTAFVEVVEEVGSISVWMKKSSEFAPLK